MYPLGYVSVKVHTPRPAPTRSPGLARHPRVDPHRKGRDLPLRPGAVARHVTFLEPIEDRHGVRGDVVVVPKVDEDNIESRSVSRKVTSRMPRTRASLISGCRPRSPRRRPSAVRISPRVRARAVSGQAARRQAPGCTRPRRIHSSAHRRRSGRRCPTPRSARRRRMRRSRQPRAVLAELDLPLV